MTKTNITLGEKIRLTRQRKRITQAKLAGKEITRNMLSLIENGSATPSLSTLKYIADRLKVPVAYLISEDDDLLFYEKKEKIKHIRDCFANKNYRTVVFNINELSGLDDELAYMLAIAQFELGRENLFKGALISAVEHFKAAENATKETVLDLSGIFAMIPMYLCVAENIQSPLIEFDKNRYHDALASAVDYEFYKYLTLDYSYEFKNDHYAAHLGAKKLIKERDYRRALDILIKLSNDIKGESYNAFLIFGVYSDMELCYRMNNDFESAYLYSGKRISLLEGFKT